MLDFFKSSHVPVKRKILSVGLFAGYLLFPFDAIPDFLVGFGLIDDAAVLLLVLQQIIKLAPASLKDKHGM
ncbi:YkvA family protein [Neobacillus notoginsengisoli]|uniref:YkvA family protein n=1 Tax=Neobacillus notoginsengisoli TaxID=1578198 RepID=UPI00308461C6